MGGDVGRSARGAGFGSLWRAGGGRRGASGGRHLRDPGRSEEHTSELQSLMRISYAVFCLKKKTRYTTRWRKNKKTRRPITHKPNIIQQHYIMSTYNKRN